MNTVLKKAAKNFFFFCNDSGESFYSTGTLLLHYIQIGIP